MYPETRSNKEASQAIRCPSIELSCKRDLGVRGNWNPSSNQENQAKAKTDKIS